MCFESFFQLYIQYNSRTADNSVLAGILIFLTWLYLSGLVLLIGAAINAVLSDRSADVSINPVVGDGPSSSGGDTQQTTVSPATAGTQLSEQVSTASQPTVTVDNKSTSLPVPDSVETEPEQPKKTEAPECVTISFLWQQDDDRTDAS